MVAAKGVSKIQKTTASLWAKSDPPYPLWRHLLDVAAVARRLLTYLPLPASFDDSLAAALIGLHDVGKADPLFQLKAPLLARAMGDDVFGHLLSGWEGEVSAFRHEARSAQVLRDLLRENRFSWSPRSIDTVRRAIRGHHGNFESQTIRDDEYPPAITARWRQMQRELCEMVLDTVGAKPCAEPEVDNLDVLGVRLSGLLVSADWIASNTALFSVRQLDDGPDAHFARALETATSSLESLGLARRTPEKSRVIPNWNVLFGSDFVPRGVQQIVTDAETPILPGLVIIEASTGEGKTEAALFLAEKWKSTLGLEGTYIALPTQATSNDLHRRYSGFLSRNHSAKAPLLVHGMAWLVDAPPLAGQLDPDSGSAAEAQRREADAWIRNARRALLAPHAVGTIDQVLLAALSVRFGFLRLLGLSHKVLIVDEVHACDTYMQERLGRVLRWCRAQSTPVILLSATLPRSHRESLLQSWYGEDARASLPPDDRYPLVTCVPFAPPNGGAIGIRAVGLSTTDRPPASRTLTIELSRFDAQQGGMSSAVERQLTGGTSETGCAALILNTVRDAQAAFRRLNASLTDDRPVLLFHARFPAWRRLEIEREVRRMFGKESTLGADRPDVALVVATQVLEQSLDVDFDTMVSAIAPIDALLQRAGRLHRHDDRCRSVSTPPRLSVVSPTLLDDDEVLGGSAKVYGELVLLRTLALLKRHGAVHLPADYRTLIEAVYAEPCRLDADVREPRLSAAREAARDASEQMRSDAQQHLIGTPVADRFEYPNTAASFSVDEAEEGEVGNNLRAKTRHGDSTTAILAITRQEEREALRHYRGGQRDLAIRRLLMEARVPVPKWWLRNSQVLAEAERHPCYLFDDTGTCEQEPRMRFTLQEGVWFEHDA